MTNIATFTPAEVETRVVKEAQVTLNLSIEQAKVVFTAMCHTNGHYGQDVYDALRIVLLDNGVDVATLENFQTDVVIDVQTLGL